MEPGRNDQHTGEGARSLILRVLQKLSRQALPASGDEPPPESLRPPGQRSGQGSESLAPYLDHYRNSRPGPLE